MSLLWFQRYDEERLASLKEIPWVVDVVQGKDIDIVILEKKQSPIQLELDRFRTDIKTRWIEVEELAFMYQWDRSILNPKPTEHGAGKFLTFRQVGEEALKKIGIMTWNGLDAVIPPSLLDKVTYSADDIIRMNTHLKTLWVNPADVKVGAKFRITTKSSTSASTYILTVNEKGLFQIKDEDEINLQKPKMIGAEFIEFNNIWQLVWDRGQTSPVQTMEKL